MSLEVNKYDKYIVNGTVLELVAMLLNIYNEPCVVSDGGSIQRIDYTNKIYGLLGQLYQEIEHGTVERF